MTLLSLALAVPSSAARVSHRFAIAHEGLRDDAISSRDGYHVAYKTSEDGLDTWKVDRRKVLQLPAGASLKDSRGFGYMAALSNDGKRLAVAGVVYDQQRQPVGQAVFLNGRQLDVYPQIMKVGFSPAGAGRLYFIARQGGNFMVVVDGVKGPMFPAEPPQVAFNANGSHFAYTGRYEDGYRVLLDHEPAGKWPGAGFYANADWSVRAGSDSEGYLHLKQKRHGPFGNITEGAISRDGSRYAVIGQGGDRVYLDGEPSGPPKLTIMDGLHFSPAGRLHWVGRQGMANTVFRDGSPLWSGQTVWGNPPFGFSESGQHAAFSAAKEQEQTALVVDGRAVLQPAPYPFSNASVVFDSEDELHLISEELDAFVVHCITLRQHGGAERCAAKAAAAGHKPYEGGIGTVSPILKSE